MRLHPCCRFSDRSASKRHSGCIRFLHQFDVSAVVKSDIRSVAQKVVGSNPIFRPNQFQPGTTAKNAVFRAFFMVFVFRARRFSVRNSFRAVPCFSARFRMNADDLGIVSLGRLPSARRCVVNGVTANFFMLLSLLKGLTLEYSGSPF